MYFVVAELAGKSKEVQTVRLLNAAGADAQEIHELFTFTLDDEKKEYKTMLRKLAEYVRPKRNVVFERHRFFSRNQKEDKPFDRWLKDLQLIAKNCEFAVEYNIIRDKIKFSVFD